MSRNRASVRSAFILAAMAALAASNLAFADDSSMSMLTGESYAYFNNLDYSLGKFNVARAAPGVTRLANRKPLMGEPMIDADHAGTMTRPAQERVAAPAARKTLPSPFRDDTGG